MRIRSIKPDYFLHVGLYDLEQKLKMPVRVAFAGLWSAADREGRFIWEPRQLKVTILPYDELDFSVIIDALKAAGLIVQYGENQQYGWIPTFLKHQRPNNKEADSVIPECPTSDMRDNLEKAALDLEKATRARACAVPFPSLPVPVPFLEEGSGEKPAMVNMNANVHRPSWEEVWIYAQPLGLAEWKARDWLDEMNACGWKDHNNRSVVQWRPMLTRVLRKWEADGRPAGPPSNAKSSKPDHRAEKAAREYPQEIQLKRL